MQVPDYQNIALARDLIQQRSMAPRVRTTATLSVIRPDPTAAEAEKALLKRRGRASAELFLTRVENMMSMLLRTKYNYLSIDDTFLPLPSLSFRDPWKVGNPVDKFKFSIYESYEATPTLREKSDQNKLFCMHKYTCMQISLKLDPGCSISSLLMLNLF